MRGQKWDRPGTAVSGSGRGASPRRPPRRGRRRRASRRGCAGAIFIVAVLRNSSPAICGADDALGHAGEDLSLAVGQPLLGERAAAADLGAHAVVELLGEDRAALGDRADRVADPAARPALGHVAGGAGLDRVVDAAAVEPRRRRSGCGSAAPAPASASTIRVASRPGQPVVERRDVRAAGVQDRLSAPSRPSVQAATSSQIVRPLHGRRRCRRGRAGWSSATSDPDWFTADSDHPWSFYQLDCVHPTRPNSRCVGSDGIGFGRTDRPQRRRSMDDRTAPPRAERGRLRRPLAVLVLVPIVVAGADAARRCSGSPPTGSRCRSWRCSPRILVLGRSTPCGSVRDTCRARPCASLLAMALLGPVPAAALAGAAFVVDWPCSASRRWRGSPTSTGSLSVLAGAQFIEAAAPATAPAVALRRWCSSAASSQRRRICS